jgi:ribose/xylose/arabinose/galactoside ABC-type transport system permease subunit
LTSVTVRRVAAGERLLATVAPVAGILGVLIAAAIASPDFYSDESLTLVLYTAGVIGVVALGQTLVLLTAGIDLSVGAVIAVTAVIVAGHTDGDGSQLPTAIALATLAGAGIGALNAGLVLVRAVPPFVATFATFVLVQGAITAATRGAPSGEIPESLSPLATDEILGAPLPLWIFAALAALVAIILARTSTGRRLYASGANRRAAELSGIRSWTVIAAAYLICSLLAVLAGVIDAGYVGHVDAQLSRSLNLDSIAAAVIGGIALTGGYGHVGHTLAGVVLLAVLLVWMVQLGVGPGGQLALEGGVILVAAWLQQGSPQLRLNRPEGGR